MDYQEEAERAHQDYLERAHQDHLDREYEAHIKDQISDEVRKIISTVMNITQPLDDDLELDSHLTMDDFHIEDVCSRIRVVFGLMILKETQMGFKTVGDIVRFVQKNKDE